MGNQLSQPQKLQPEHLAEVPKVVLKENLGEAQTNVAGGFDLNDDWECVYHGTGNTHSQYYTVK